MLKKEAGRAGLNHMRDAVKISGNPREDWAVGEAEGQAVSPSWALRGNYALLMANIAALPHESELCARAAHRCARPTNMQLATPELSVTGHQLI